MDVKQLKEEVSLLKNYFEFFQQVKFISSISKKDLTKNNFWLSLDENYITLFFVLIEFITLLRKRLIYEMNGFRNSLMIR